MKRIIIINNSDRALSYGIGSYSTNLIECLRATDFAFDVVYLNSDIYELRIVEKNDYREFFIPAFTGSTNKKLMAYCKMLPFLFKELFNADDEIIFHFNWFFTDLLLAELKAVFNCKILLPVHFTDWSFQLNGDYRKLISILDKVKKEDAIPMYEKRVLDIIKLEKAIFHQSDLIMFVAKHTAKTYTKISLLQETKYMIINNGLKDEYKRVSIAQKRAIRKRYHIKDHETILFFAGRLDEIKGVYCLIEAFRKVLLSKQDVRLFIAGEGDFSKLLSKSRFSGTQITFLGFLDKSELYNFYRIADIGISCSIHEEFGLVALEMMMHQLPVIVTNTGGLAEIVEDNVDGLKVPVVYKKGKLTVDIAQLASKITYLIDHPHECKRLGENARKKFLSDYELSVFSYKMNQVYQSIFSKNEQNP